MAKKIKINYNTLIPWLKQNIFTDIDLSKTDEYILNQTIFSHNKYSLIKKSGDVKIGDVIEVSIKRSTPYPYNEYIHLILINVVENDDLTNKLVITSSTVTHETNV